ncbi:hypothetical protein Q3G72_027806 [Acer saccharum]|nr:hypothetical protein Q3G72_027806 [Acer saccharum]
MSKLFKEQLDAMRKIGFGILLELCCGRLRRELCKYLIDNFDITNHSLNINDNKIVLNPSMFAKTIGIIDGSLIVNLKGFRNHIEKLKSKYYIEGNGIPLHKIEKKLINLTTADEEFKVPAHMHWLFYIHSMHLDEPIVDNSVIPIVGWKAKSIKKAMKVIKQQGGLNCVKIKYHLNLNDFDKNSNPKKQTEGLVTKDESNASASKQHPSTPPKQQQPEVEISSNVSSNFDSNLEKNVYSPGEATNFDFGHQFLVQNKATLKKGARLYNLMSLLGNLI